LSGLRQDARSRGWEGNFPVEVQEVPKKFSAAWQRAVGG